MGCYFQSEIKKQVTKKLYDKFEKYVNNNKNIENSNDILFNALCEIRDMIRENKSVNYIDIFIQKKQNEVFDICSKNDVYFLQKNNKSKKRIAA